MPRTFTADSDGPAAEAWSLFAEPDRWHEWAPQLRGAWGLGRPEVQAGRTGAARLLGVLPVPARIVAKDERSWTWRVGAVVTMVHAVDERPGGGCRISWTVAAPGPLEPAIAAAYGPVVSVLLGRLARRAASVSSAGS